MIDEIKAHWWWLTALGAAIAGGVRWLFGMQSQIDRLTENQKADKEELNNKLMMLQTEIKTEQRDQREKIDHLLEMSARNETKLDSVHTYIRLLARDKQ
jgi:hypothetical protein